MKLISPNVRPKALPVRTLATWIQVQLSSERLGSKKREALHGPPFLPPDANRQGGTNRHGYYLESGVACASVPTFGRNIAATLASIRSRLRRAMLSAPDDSIAAWKSRIAFS